jgi:hypothetical protein
MAAVGGIEWVKRSPVDYMLLSSGTITSKTGIGVLTYEISPSSCV